MKKIKILFILVWTVSIASWLPDNQAVLPTKAQLEWADAEIGVLIHFDMQVLNLHIKVNKYPDFASAHSNSAFVGSTA